MQLSEVVKSAFNHINPARIIKVFQIRFSLNLVIRQCFKHRLSFLTHAANFYIQEGLALANDGVLQ